MDEKSLKRSNLPVTIPFNHSISFSTKMVRSINPEQGRKQSYLRWGLGLEGHPWNRAQEEPL